MMRPKITVVFTITFLLTTVYLTVTADHISFKDIDTIFETIINVTAKWRLINTLSRTKQMIGAPFYCHYDFERLLRRLDHNLFTSNFSQQIRINDEVINFADRYFEEQKPLSLEIHDIYDKLMDKVSSVNCRYDIGLEIGRFDNDDIQDLVEIISDFLYKSQNLVKRNSVKTTEREDRFRSVIASEFPKMIDECDDCSMKSDIWFLFFWHYIKSEIMGFLTIMYANLLHFYKTREPYKRIVDVKGNTMKRIKWYYDRIPPCACEKHPYSLRVLEEVKDIPFPMSNRIEFIAKFTDQPTTINLYKFEVVVFTIMIKSDSVDIYGYYGGTIMHHESTLAYLEDVDYGSYWIELTNGVIGVGPSNSDIPILRSWTKIDSLEIPILHTFNFIPNGRGAWIAGVTISGSLAEVLPQKSAYWCPLENLTDSDSLEPTYISREMQGDFETKSNQNESTSVMVLSLCGLSWVVFDKRKPVPNIIFMSTDNSGDPLTYCRYEYNSTKIIGELRNRMCTVKHSNGVQIIKQQNFEILIQPYMCAVARFIS